MALNTTDLIGYIAMSLTTAAFAPQALHTLKTRDVSGISLAMYASFTVGVFLWLIYGLLRGDYASRMTGYATGRQNGWLSANDIRELEDMNRIPASEGGDLFLVNGSMTKLVQAGAFAGNDSPVKQSTQRKRKEEPNEKQGFLELGTG